MGIEGFTLPLSLLFIGAILIAIIAFFSGKKTGSSQEKMEMMEIEKNYSKKLNIEISKNDGLQRDNNNLKEKNQIYLNFLIKIPDAVKNLNSNLTFDETISSIIRLTKDIVDAGVIELYIFNKGTNSIELVAAYGSIKKEKISIEYGVGLLGTAMENKTTALRTAFQSSECTETDDGIGIAAPILFKGELVGMLGIGNIKSSSGNERRFISMVADFAGVALQNCEHMETAQKEANTDALTGLYNRRYFFERAIEAAQKAFSYNSPLSIFIFDIDHFKKYNDTNGHAEGDYLLKELSRILRENTRGLDIIARYGGEEFIALLPNTDKNGASIYAEKIRKIIETYTFKHREKQPSGYVSVSGGVATFPSDGNTIDAVVRCADEALYISKKSGRNMVTRYEPFHFST